MAYDKYLEVILGLNDDTGNQPFRRKKLFGFLKSSRADALGRAVLKKGDAACTGNVDQANLLNAQFNLSFQSDHHSVSQNYVIVNFSMALHPY